MFVRNTCLSAGAAVVTLACAGVVQAQTESFDSLMAMGTSGLRGEMQRRYDEALSLSTDQSVVAVDSTRFMWATQAKVQCGIAIGYLKSGNKDPVSVGKCLDAYARMQEVPVPPPPPPPQLCQESVAGTIYFDWDSATPPANAGEVIDSVVAKNNVCNWSSISVVGHTDRSGSDAYNERLADRRARAVAGLLEEKGIIAEHKVVSGMGERDNKVPTEDGVREAQNRRVEVTVY